MIKIKHLCHYSYELPPELIQWIEKSAQDLAWAE
jgi:hypothetical protein